MKRFLGPTLAFLFPFVYYFRFVVPNSSLLVIENDFDYLYYSYKGYLVDLVAHGHFPWWSPAEAAGYSFFGNPFTAPLYPLNVLPLVTRLLVGNYNLYFHQIYTVLGVSLFALGTYRWLYAMYARAGAALFASAVLAASWSIGEFMRFPNAVHVMAWVPWVLASIRAVHFDSRLRAVYGGMACLFCEITAGYPYFVVYSFFLYIMYIFYLHWASPLPKWRGRVLRQLFLFLTPVLILAPYFSAVSFVLRLTRDRAGGNFIYATEHPFSMVDLVSSFVFPPFATVEGCFYPGIFAVFLFVLYFWRHPDSRERVAVMTALIGILVVVLGYRSYFFTPLWSLLPVVNQMRAFSRVTIIALPLLALAIHQGYAVFRDQLGASVDDRKWLARAIRMVFGIILIIQVFLYFVKDRQPRQYTELHQPLLPGGSTELDFLMMTLFTLGVALYAVNVDWARMRHGGAIVLGTLLAVVTLDSGIQGRFLWSRPLEAILAERGIPVGRDTPLILRAYEFAKRKADFFRLVRDYFVLDRHDESEMPWPGFRGLTALGLGAVAMPNFDYESYWKFREATSPQQLFRLLGPAKLFFHGAVHPNAGEFLADVDAHAGQMVPTVEYFDGSELRVEVLNAAPGYLTWIDNFDPGWSASVDGSPVAIQRSLTTFKAIPLAPGDHEVRFIYRPVISSGAFAAMAAGLFAPLLLALGNRWRGRFRDAG